MTGGAGGEEHVCCREDAEAESTAINAGPAAGPTAITIRT